MPARSQTATLPRPEYPRPQFVRPDWLCLNGEWQFEVDAGDSGLPRGILQRDLAGRITVPFCPESELSGIGNVDYMLAVWYRRVVDVPADWKGRRTLLHFGACDYDTTVWVDGVEAGRHRGGFTPFAFDLGDVAGKSLTLTVRARDDWRPPQARGKQSQTYANEACNYTRTTGIWQTVWLEPVPDIALLRPRLTPDVGNCSIRLEQPLSAGGPGPNRPGLRLRATLTDDAGEVVTAQCPVLDFAPRLDLAIPDDRRRLWSIDDPHLYGLTIELLDENGQILDAATSYAGLRSVTLDGKAIRINGDIVFQRLVLDQGFYPDGILTAPTDAALKADIELSMQAGFNGARLHQKVFEERFLYWADKLGYLVWGEFPDWGCNRGGPSGDNQQPDASYITQWLEAIERDYSHPSIVGWCPLNETWQRLTDRITVLDDITRGMFLATKALDATRPVLDASGYSHRVLETDIYDNHDYEQDPAQFAANHAGTRNDQPFVNKRGSAVISTPYRGQPIFCSEFGGIWWNPDAKPGEASWGYGNRPQSLEEFFTRFEGLCAALLDDPSMFGYCYTQLTDVYQEQNGIYRFNRDPKFDLARIRAAQQRPAAIESSDPAPTR